MNDQATQNINMQSCIDDCNWCHEACLSTAMNFCLPRGGAHIDANHIRLMVNCAELCQTAANFMLSGSPLHGAVCAACVEVCTSCARGCEELGDMDECVQACLACAESCEDMACASGYLIGGQLPPSEAAALAHF